MLFSKISIKILLVAFCIIATLKITAQGNVYAVVVAIAEYKQTNLNLPATTLNDADSMYSYLTSVNGANAPAENIKLLKNSDATKANIKAALNEYFARATEKDKVIFFFSGHGAEGAFSTYDLLVKGEINGKLDLENALTHEEVKEAFKNSKASMKLCFADACHSGSIIKNENSTARKEVFTSSLKKLSMDQKSLVIMMSSRASESSAVSPELKASYFAFNLIEGLKGKGDLNKDKKITIKELYSYVRTRVRAFTKAAQTPVVFGKFNVDDVIVDLK